MTEQLENFGTALIALAGAPFVVACVLGVIVLLAFMIRKGL